MSHIPKTPKTPRHRSRSDAQTPLTPSIINGLNSVNLANSPTKRTRGRSKSKTSSGPFDTTNPFISAPRAAAASKSRNNSPVKRTGSTGIIVNGSSQRQAASGLVSKKSVERDLNVITLEYPPPKELKRSRSTPATSRSTSGDRFITTTQREEKEVAPTLEKTVINPETSSPGHTARLAEAAGVPHGRRILGYHEPPPASASDSTLSQQRDLARPLYTRPASATTGGGAPTHKTRRIPTQPERILDAPNIIDDYYLNLVSWSCLNMLSVALDDSTYLWKADSGNVTRLGQVPEGDFVSSVDFSNDGMFIGVGTSAGDVELYDVETGQKLRSMGGHQAQIATLSWNNHVLSSGCGDGSIWHHDVRMQQHKVMELIGHAGEVCGLKWRPDGELLASGGNDNVVNIWDGRVGSVTEGSRVSPKITKRNHTAAVKALAWCPWQTSLLATGGGTNDATINVWNSVTGARLHTVKTPAQVTSIIWSPHRKELASTHGYPTNAIMLFSYPSMEQVAEIRDAHDTRVLYSALSPAGDVIATAAGDENLKFWRLWEVETVKKTKGVKESRSNSTSSSMLAIR